MLTRLKQKLNVCWDLIGGTPTDDVLDGANLSLPWLAVQFNNFVHLSKYADEELQHYARAYILSLIRGMIFTNKSNNRVHLMYLPLLEYFDEVETYNSKVGCLVVQGLMQGFSYRR